MERQGLISRFFSRSTSVAQERQLGLNSYVDNRGLAIACRQVATFFATTDNS